MEPTMDDGRLIQESWSEPMRFAELFHRHYGAVRQLCARRVGSSESEDLVGETFCRAFEHRRRFDVSRPDARPWLFGIALNLVRTHHRGRFRRGNAYERSARLVDVEVDDSSRVERAVDARRELAAVEDALLGFPDSDVDMLLLHVWEQLSYKAIAEALDVPVATVRLRLYHIRRRLREAIDRDAPERSAPGIVAASTPGVNRES
jgi:RNA polymerase sigma-70 factor (ECF subfamily)